MIDVLTKSWFIISSIVSKTEEKQTEIEVDLPDDSLADADLKEHNIIDSVTYLYGFNSCHGVRNEWMILVSAQWTSLQVFIVTYLNCFSCV